MELRKSLEVAIVEKFTAKGKKAKESILMFPPIKEYDSLEIKEKCMNNGLNAKLTISPNNYNSGAKNTLSFFTIPFDNVPGCRIEGAVE